VRFARKEPVRNLNQNARAITCFRIAPARPAVHEILQDLQPFQHNVVRGFPADIDYKANSAGISLVGRIVETLGRG
jgi:hypothetical protein